MSNRLAGEKTSKTGNAWLAKKELSKINGAGEMISGKIDRHKVKMGEGRRTTGGERNGRHIFGLWA